MDWDRLTVRAGAAEQFGRLVAQAASPIDDVRGTAAYRRHALSVLAVRTLQLDAPKESWRTYETDH